MCFWSGFFEITERDKNNKNRRGIRRSSNVGWLAKKIKVAKKAEVAGNLEKR